MKPPPRIILDLERSVMDQIKEPLVPRFMSGLRPRLALMVVVVIIVGIGIRLHHSTALPPLTFDETTIVFDHHIAVWLEPVESKGKS